MGKFLLTSIFLLALAITLAEQPPALQIVTHMPEEVVEGYGRSSVRINRAYAERHGYKFSLDNKDHTKGKRDPRWSKVQVIKQAMDKLDESVCSHTLVCWASCQIVCLFSLPPKPTRAFAQTHAQMRTSPTSCLISVYVIAIILLDYLMYRSWNRP